MSFDGAGACAFLEGKYNVKHIRFIRRGIGALAVAVATVGYAQVAPAGAGPAVSTAASNSGEPAGPGKAALRAENRALQKEVLRSLSRTKGLDASNIVVVARGGVVTLNGSVPQADQVERAIAVARRVSGVGDVKSHLGVRPEGS
ncbi:MAG: BON domain-containing protein [Paraburkholderia sp.]|jgi:osmotically-inducible protein OsmY|nr:BON domain-containing protein [Paraburkholderia sp.]